MKNSFLKVTIIFLALTTVHCSNGGSSDGTSTLVAGASDQAVVDAPAIDPATGAAVTLATLPTLPFTCDFPVAGQPDSSLVYDPTALTVTTTTGSPAATQTFSSITTRTGLPPYGAAGVSFLAFSDVPLFSVTIDASNNLVATWGLAPGGPTGVLNAGTCTITTVAPPPPPPGDTDDDDDCHHHHHHRHGHHRHHHHDHDRDQDGDRDDD